MDVVKYPIILIAICFGLGIVIQNYAYFSLTTLLFSSLLFFILFLLLFFKNQNTKNIFFGLVTYFLILSVGSLSLFIHQDFHVKNNYSNLEVKEQNNIKGLVVEELKSNEFYTKFIVKIDSFNQQKSSGKLLVYFEQV